MRSRTQTATKELTFPFGAASAHMDVCTAAALGEAFGGRGGGGTRMREQSVRLYLIVVCVSVSL